VQFAQGYTPPDPATGLGTGDTAQDYKGNYGVNWGTGRFDLGTKSPPTPQLWVWNFATQKKDPALPGPFENPDVVSGKEIPKFIKLKQITDGTSKTLLFLEMRQAPTGTVAEGDNGIDRRARLWIPASSTFQISTLLSPNSQPCSAAGGLDDKLGCGPDIGYCLDQPKDIPCDRQTGNAGVYTLASRSRHPGGVSVALCDSSVRYVADDVDIAVWRSFGSRGGDEVSAGEL
jgi:hypothetical protein